MVNNDKQLYICASCGSTYDYEYFREEEMHSMADTYLSREEFMAAVDAYRFILRKDPHDFRALRGLMLVAAQMVKVDDLTRGQKTQPFSYNAEIVKEAIYGASDKDRAYFEEFGNIYSEKGKLYYMINEIEALRKEKRVVDDSINLKNQTIDEAQYDGIHPVVLIFLAAAILMFSILLGILISIWEESILGFFCGFPVYGLSAIFLLVAIIKNQKKVKGIKASTVGLYDKSNSLGDEIKRLESESDALAAKIRESSLEFVKKDKELMNRYK